MLLENFASSMKGEESTKSREEINEFFRAVDLHVSLLYTELTPEDNKRLQRAMLGLKAIFRFHPTKYSFMTFIIAWFVEWLYFI